MRLLTTCILLMLSLGSSATTVRFETTVGNIDIELFDEEAPVTVANFLTYVNDGDYDNTVIHRSVPGFVIQGGAFRYQGSSNFETVPTNSTIVNEFGQSNLEGTIAMALAGSNINSATNQWFINLVNNQGLDDLNFTVFGKVIRGMEIVKIIESFLRINFSSSNIGAATSEFPLYGFFSGTAVTLNNPVKIIRAYELSEIFQITEGISGAWVTPGINGQGLYIEVLPAANVIIMAWFTFDSSLPDSGVPSSIGDAGNRWLTGSGTYQDNIFTGAIFKTSEGLFDSFVPVVNTENGSFTIEFENCSNAIMSYILNDAGESNTIALQRVSGINIDFCEALALNAAPGIAAQ